MRVVNDVYIDDDEEEEEDVVMVSKDPEEDDDETIMLEEVQWLFMRVWSCVKLKKKKRVQLQIFS